LWSSELCFSARNIVIAWWRIFFLYHSLYTIFNYKLIDHKTYITEEKNFIQRYNQKMLLILVIFTVFKIIKEKACYAYVYKLYIEQNKIFPNV
jgi:hypothetical protein